MRILNARIVVTFLVAVSTNFAFAGEAAKAVGLSILQSLGEAISTSRQEEINSAYKSYIEETVKLRDSGQINSSELAKRLRQKHEELYGSENSYNKEYWDYYEYIEFQRDTKGMSKQEATYLLQKKINDINERKSPEVTPPREKKLDYKCAEDCKKSGYGYDYCDSRCSY